MLIIDLSSYREGTSIDSQIMCTYSTSHKDQLPALPGIAFAVGIKDGEKGKNEKKHVLFIDN